MTITNAPYINLPNGHALVRVEGKNHAHVAAKAIAAGVVMHELHHPETCAALEWLYVECAGNYFVELIKDVVATVYQEGQ